MPKSPSALNSKSGSEEPTVTTRKKKNADAQAAFRARRANYIATLEETVTSLESVVLQLQDSCHEAHSQISELKQENMRVRLEFRERDKYWRALWHTRKSGSCPDPDNLPSLPPTPPAYSPVHPHSNALASQLTSPHGNPHLTQYAPENMCYRTGDDLNPMPNGPFHVPSNHGYANQSPTLPYSFPMHSTNRTPPQWPQAVTHTPSSGAESGGPNTATPLHSPAYPESPSSNISYIARFTTQDQKLQVNLESAPYIFPVSRSMSPSNSSSSSPSITSPFQFIQEGAIAQDRHEYAYRRHNGAHTHTEVTLHGGTADISLAPSATDGVRYRLSARRAESAPEILTGVGAPPLPALICGSENGSPVRGGNERDPTPLHPNHHLRSARLRRTIQRSRSPSPGGGRDGGSGGGGGGGGTSELMISGTLAVIKAQAFGAFRRARPRTKRTSERDAAKVALDVLEARGIGMGIGAPSPSGPSRRARSTHGDNMDT